MKKITLIFIVILCTACSANYDIFVKDDGIEEKSSILINKSEENYDNLISNFNANLYGAIESINNKDNLLIENIDNNNVYGINYYNKYNFNNYGQSILLKECYENVDVYTNSGYLNINTSDNFKCFEYYNYLSNINITVRTDHKLSGNYDNKEGNTYIWNIDRTNYNSKPIKMSLKINKNSINNQSNVSKFFDIIIYLIVIIILFSFVVIYNKVKKSNK